MTDIQVQKRNGTLEPLDVDKIHEMIERCLEGLNRTGISVSEIAVKSHIQFTDGISTAKIQDILIKTAVNLISTKAPQYQFAAARLLLAKIRKEIYGTFQPPSLLSIVQKNAQLGLYDPALEGFYTHAEWAQLDSLIDHTRDGGLTYAALKQFTTKYLVMNRLTGQLYETPQIAYMLVAATIFQKEPKATRLATIKEYYDALSKNLISIATPILAGVRTTEKQYSSCVLIRSDDTLQSQFSVLTAQGTYVAQKSGIGVEVGGIRGVNAPIRGGQVIHSGLVSYIQSIQSVINYCSQGGIRKGSATVFYPIWHIDVERLLPLKKNTGADSERARFLDYGIGLSELFLKRYLTNGTITLFDPHEVPAVYANFGMPGWDAIYEAAEQNPLIKRKSTIGARELLNRLFTERAETGRLYLFFIDHANSHSSFLDKIWQSNLCMEVTLPTSPFQHLQDTNGEIATCILSAINLLKLESYKDIEPLARLLVRSLDAIVGLQSYPYIMSQLGSQSRRSIGVGWLNWAAYLAKNGLKWDSDAACEQAHQLAESTQFYLLKASNELAKEIGPCDWFHKTKYSKGILPIDTYKKEVDTVAPFPLLHDWENLRGKIAAHGLRNSTLTCIMPSESSSVLSNATNGIEAPRGPKQNKGMPILVPGIGEFQYEYQWSMPDNKAYLKIAAIIGKFFDQSISTNVYYNPFAYEGERVPYDVVLGDIFLAYKLGLKSMYYHITYDDNDGGSQDEGCDGGCKL